MSNDSVRVSLSVTLAKHFPFRGNQIMFLHFFAQIWIICLVNHFCKGVESSELNMNAVGCQHKSTSGRDYRGRANTTSSGLPCKTWSHNQPLDHPFTSVGDHQLLREPFWHCSKVWSMVPDQLWISALFSSLLLSCESAGFFTWQWHFAWPQQHLYSCLPSEGKPSILIYHLCCFYGGTLGNVYELPIVPLSWQQEQDMVRCGTIFHSE